jgi:hypothetical protein
MASAGDDRQRPLHGNAGVSNNGPSAAAAAAAAEEIPIIVYALGPNDVLMGRGTPISNNIGNMRFRDLIRTRKEEYLSHWRHQIKHNIARQVHAEIIRRKGRFLRPMDSLPRRRRLGIPDGVKAWEVVNEEACLEKIKQALRGKDTLPTGVTLHDAALVKADPPQLSPNGLGLPATPSAAGAAHGNTRLAFGAAAGAAPAPIGTTVPLGGTANAAGQLQPPPLFQLNPQLLPPAGQSQGQSAPQLQQQIDTLYMSLLQQPQPQQQQQQQQPQLFFPPLAPPAPAPASSSTPVSLTSDIAVREQLIQMILYDPSMMNLLLTRLQAGRGLGTTAPVIPPPPPPPPPPPQPMLSANQSPISALQALLQQVTNSNPLPPPAVVVASNNSSADPQQFIANAVSAFLQSQSSGAQLSQPSMNNQANNAITALFPSLAALPPPQQQQPSQGTTNAAAVATTQPPSLGNLVAALSGGSQFPPGPLAAMAQQYQINLANAAVAASQSNSSSVVAAAQSSGTAAAAAAASSPSMTSFSTGNSADLAAQLQGQAALHGAQAGAFGVLSPGPGARIGSKPPQQAPVVLLALPSRSAAPLSNTAAAVARAPTATTSATVPSTATTTTATSTAKPEESSSSYETGSSGASSSTTSSSDEKPKRKRSRRTSPV